MHRGMNWRAEGAQESSSVFTPSYLRSSVSPSFSVKPLWLCASVVQGHKLDHSTHRVAVEGRIPPGHMVLELPLDVGQQARRPHAEQLRLQPLAPQLLLHQELIGEHILGRGDASRRLV